MSKLNVVGFDPALENWGIACGQLDTKTRNLVVTHLECVKPAKLTGKNINNNHKDLYRAEQLAERALYIGGQAQALFVEVPVGSQSARAMASYGVCVGIMATLRASSIPFFQVTPGQVKTVVTGKTSGTKRQMIDWATSQHPEANWPTYTRKGQQMIVEGQAEHMADALCAIYAGLRDPQFNQMLLLNKSA